MGDFLIHNVSASTPQKVKTNEDVVITNFKPAQVSTPKNRAANQYSIQVFKSGNIIKATDENGFYMDFPPHHLDMSSGRYAVFKNLMKSDKSSDKKGEILTFSDLQAAAKSGMNNGKVVIEDVKQGKARLEFMDGGALYFDFKLPNEK